MVITLFICDDEGRVLDRTDPGPDRLDQGQ
jgi:hypothetical protein